MNKIRFVKSIEIEIDAKAEIARLNNAYNDIPMLRDLLLDVTMKTFEGNLEEAVIARANAESAWNQYYKAHGGEPMMEDYYSPFAAYLHMDVSKILGDVYNVMSVRAEYEAKGKQFDRDRVAKIVPMYELVQNPSPSKSPKM